MHTLSIVKCFVAVCSHFNVCVVYIVIGIINIQLTKNPMNLFFALCQVFTIIVKYTATLYSSLSQLEIPFFLRVQFIS